MNDFIVDNSKCIGCGLCVKDCGFDKIKLEEEKAVFNNDMACMNCDHCSAVCPTNAISRKGLEGMKAYSDERTMPSSEELSNLLKTKRSMRFFKEKEVEKEVIDKLLEIGRLAPTGGNAQNIKYIVITSVETMEKIRLTTMKTAMEVSKAMPEPYKTVLSSLLPLYEEKGEDRLFKKAPLLIVFYGNNVSEIDAGINSTYMNLLAESLGLGSCYIGLLPMLANDNEELRELLHLHEGDMIATSLVIGYPNVVYKRDVNRNKLNATFL